MLNLQDLEKNKWGFSRIFLGNKQYKVLFYWLHRRVHFKRKVKAGEGTLPCWPISNHFHSALFDHEFTRVKVSTSPSDHQPLMEPTNSRYRDSRESIRNSGPESNCSCLLRRRPTVTNARRMRGDWTRSRWAAGRLGPTGALSLSPADVFFYLHRIFFIYLLSLYWSRLWPLGINISFTREKLCVRGSRLKYFLCDKQRKKNPRKAVKQSVKPFGRFQARQHVEIFNLDCQVF